MAKHELIDWKESHCKTGEVARVEFFDDSYSVKNSQNLEPLFTVSFSSWIEDENGEVVKAGISYTREYDTFKAAQLQFMQERI